MVIDRGDLGEVPVMLVVGNLRDWARDGRIFPHLDGFHFADFSEIDADLLERTEPDIVLSALIADGFDAVDLARKLAQAGFEGRYRAITNTLPNPNAIIAEIRAAAPNLDFDLYTINKTKRH